MASHLSLKRNGDRLSGTDFGGAGPSALMLHGLAGYAGEWAETAAGLSDSARVVAFDARGHGDSERRPADVSRAAHVGDAEFVIEALGLAPVVVVGQSLGGQTALLVAAKHPGLVRGLVVVEASPAPGSDAHVSDVERALRSWPVPFPSRGAAVEFFSGRGFPAQAWADGLERRDGGWWPRFDVEILVDTLRQADSRDYWDEWESIRCPTLVVRGEHGTVPPEHAEELISRAWQARLAVIADAGHDVHLERPGEWLHVLQTFLAALR